MISSPKFTVRATSQPVRQVLLSAGHRTYGDVYNPTWSFTTPFAPSSPDCRLRLELDRCVLRNTFDNLTSSNNILRWTENTTHELTATIPVGDYDANSFCDAAKIAMEDAINNRCNRSSYI